jgi:hypothetical protein
METWADLYVEHIRRGLAALETGRLSQDNPAEEAI